MRSSIPMTPRSVVGSGGVDFARQLREQNATATNTKKFRSSAAPKGTRLASGYQDRTQLRTSVEEDDKASRIKALEEMVKLGQMEQPVFEALRDEIVGGDVKDVHLVKGLDYKLLERVRRGEDVLAEKPKLEEQDDEEFTKEGGADVDEAFDDLENKEVIPLAKEERAKKGEMAPPSAIAAGRKRTRDDILRELKESRIKAAEEKKAQQPSLGPKFKKLGAQKESSRIERDERGREVLITVDEDGNVKKKVKRAKDENNAHASRNSLLMPDKGVKPLGMEAPELKVPPPLPMEEDIDIFEGVGNDYNPLGTTDDLDSDDSDGDEISNNTRERVEAEKEVYNVQATGSPNPTPLDMPSPPLPNKPSNPGRNYFTDASSEAEVSSTATANPLTDPTILAALKKASSIKPLSSSTETADVEEQAKLARRKKMLEAHDRDAEDMDLGFGSSRFEDQEEGENRKVKLSVWSHGGGGGGGDDDDKGEAKEKRKRGGKKRKGDKDSAADVLRVMDRRKEEGK